MAFYSPEDDEEEGGPKTLNAGSGVIGADAGTNSTPGGAGTASAPNAEPFFGISQYINANKPQSEKLAGQVVGNVNDKAAAVDTGLNNATNSFNQAANSQKVDADSNLFGAVENDAASVAGDEAKKNEFTKLRDASYSGPQTIQDVDNGQSWAGIQNALTKAKTAKDQTGTEEGRMGLIKEISNNPRQSQGALVFDNLLLQSNPNAAAQLQGAGSSLNGIDDRLAAAQTNAGQTAAQIAANNKTVSDQAKSALTTGYGNLQNSLQTREQEGDAAQLKLVNQLKEALYSGQLSPEQIQQLSSAGLTADTHTFGADPSQYLNYVDQNDIYSGATGDDLARQDALMSLAGDTSLGQPILNSANPIGQKGSGFNFDANGFQSATDAKAQAYRNAISAPGSANALGIQGMQGGQGEFGPDESLETLIQKYENPNYMGNSVAPDPVSIAREKAMGKDYLENVLYKARDAIQAKYGYNDTLTNRAIPNAPEGYLSNPGNYGRVR